MNHSNRLLKLTCFLLMTMIAATLHSQPRQPHDMPSRSVRMELAVFPGNDPAYSELDVLLWFSNSQLQFQKNDSNFVSRYQINLEIDDANGVAVLTRDTTFLAVELSYSETISMALARQHYFRFQIRPGEYEINARLFDLNSGGTSQTVRKLSIPKFDRNKLQISDFYIVTMDSLNTTSKRTVIYPMQVTLSEPHFVYFILQRPQTHSKIQLELQAIQPNDIQTTLYSGTIQPNNEISPLFIQLRREQIARGTITLKLTARSDVQTVTKSKRVRFVEDNDNWQTGTINMQLTPSMIEQLQLVAQGNEWNNIKNARSAIQDSLFKEFWKLRDPTPLSDKNELFQEYYKRVNTANLQFSDDSNGWSTDQGKVYIIYGPPDAVEYSTPSQFGFAEYEIWYYDELKKKFVFLDEQGTGDLRLVSGNLYSY
ncbi:GWxTD domain-containing protein [candidate division KSB1 bacterium]|nr:GWxTD domain-containing protein [candidate division KSB1 bacterium]